MVDKDALFILSQLFFLRTQISSFPQMHLAALVFGIGWEYLSSLFYLLTIHSPTSAIHDSHQGLLVASEVDFVRREHCLEPLLLILLILLPS